MNNEIKKLSIIYSNNRLTSLELEKFQDDFGIVLPNFFIDFFLKYEGTEVKEDTFKNQFQINRFLNFESKRNASFVSIYKTYVDEFSVKTWIPFAIDSGGWVFVLSILERDFGKVYIDKFDSGNENSFELLSPSFQDFMDGLEAMDD